MQKKFFRCPFEVQGIKEGTILDVRLSENKNERIEAMCDALRKLYADRKWISVRFVLPSSILTQARSHWELREVIVPYQAEFIASDMHCRLAPFLWYQRGRIRRLLLTLRREMRYERLAVKAFRIALMERGSLPRNVVELSSVIQKMFEEHYAFRSYGAIKAGARVFDLLVMDPSALAIYKPQHKLADPKVNNALFSIVKSPFYPEAFGRYSENVEIVVTRDVDVVLLSEETRSRIRDQANEVHIEHHVPMYEEQQPAGHWIPGERYRL